MSACQEVQHVSVIYRSTSISALPVKRTVWEHNQRSSDRYAGYKALWIKVIIRAAFDWVSYRDSLKLDQQKEAEKAYRWLFEPSVLFNSFENVCQLVDFHPNTIRAWAKTLTKEHVAKIEHLERVPMGTVALAMAERKLIEGRDETD